MGTLTTLVDKGVIFRPAIEVDFMFDPYAKYHKGSCARDRSLCIGVPLLLAILHWLMRLAKARASFVAIGRIDVYELGFRGSAVRKWLLPQRVTLG